MMLEWKNIKPQLFDQLFYDELKNYEIYTN